MPAIRSVLETVVAALLGAVTGVLGSYVQQLVAGERRWPVGSVLGVLLVAAVALSVHLGALGRLARVGLAVGWFAAVTLASTRRREGDLLVLGDSRGWGFLIGGTLVLGITVALPRARRVP